MAILFHGFPHPDEAAQALADAVAIDLIDVIASKGRAVLAVSGGKTPIAFFQHLSNKDLDWQNVHIQLVDDRIVSTDHDDSNASLVRRHLLQNKSQSATFTSLVPDQVSDSALQVDAVITAAISSYQDPDILILGMGADGHTASLFPQAPQFQEAISLNFAQPLLHVTPVTAPYERITMSLAAILKTPKIYLEFDGAEKKVVYDQASLQKIALYPVSYVLNAEVSCHVYHA